MSVILLIITWTYVFYREPLIKKANSVLCAELSKAAKRNITIGSISYLPPQTLIFRDINIFAPGSDTQKDATIKRLSITFEPVLLFVRKQLFTLVEIKGLTTKYISLNALLRTSSKKGMNYGEACSFALIDNIAILVGDISFEKGTVKNINGSVDMNTLSLTRGKIHFSYTGNEYLLSFDKSTAADIAYHAGINARDLKFNGTFIKDGNDITINALSGAYESIKFFGVDCTIKNAFSPERESHIKGYLDTTVKGLSPVNEKLAGMIAAKKIDGKLKAAIDLTLKPNNQFSLYTALNAKDISYDNIKIDSFSTQAHFIPGGKLKLYYTKVGLYKGALSGEMEINTLSKDGPAISSLAAEIKNLDLASFLAAVTGKKQDRPGSLDLNITARLREQQDGSLDQNAQGYITPSTNQTDPYKEIMKYNVQAEFRLRNPFFGKINISELSGRVFLQDESISVKDLSGILYGAAFRADLALLYDKNNGFSVPEIVCDVQNMNVGNFLLSTTNKKQDGLGILSFNASLTKKTQTEPHGDLQDNEKTSDDNNGETDFYKILRGYTGDITIDWRDIELANMDINSASGNLRLENSRLIADKINGKLYNGSFRTGFTLELDNAPTPYVSKIDMDVTNLDLRSFLHVTSGTFYKGLGRMSFTASLERKEGAIPPAASAKKPKTYFWNDLKDYTGNMSFTLSDAEIQNIKILQLGGKLTLGENTLFVSNLNGFMYNGTFSADFDIPLYGRSPIYLPHVKVRTENMDIGALLTDVTGEKYDNVGLLTLNTSLSRNKNAKNTADFAKDKGLYLYNEIRNYSGTASVRWEEALINDWNFNELTAEFILSGKFLKIQNLKSSFYNGNVTGNVAIVLKDDRKPYISSAECKIIKMNLGEFLNNVYDMKNKYTGILTLYFAIDLKKGMIPVTKNIKNKMFGFLSLLSHYNGTSVFILENAGFNNIKFSGLSGKLKLDNNTLHTKDVEGSLYNGSFFSDFEMRLDNPSFPYMFSFKTEYMEIGKLLYDLDHKNTDVYGITHSSLSIKGNAVDNATMWGNGSLRITKADLGPLPILTPIVGNIYVAIQSIFAPDQVLKINAAELDFSIENKRVSTTNAVLSGDGVEMVADGYVNFDGTLNVYFKNQFINPEEAQSDESMQTSIIKTGRSLGSARLKGTIQKPKWDWSTTR